jgi:hypothetical protein
MSDRLQELARRKASLISQCARDREEFAYFYNQIRLSLNLGAVIRALGRTLSAHPALAVGISGLIASGYARKASKTLGGLARISSVAQPLFSWWSKRAGK